MAYRDKIKIFFLPVALILLLIVAGTLQGCFFGGKNRYGYLQEAEELTRKGELDQAIEKYRRHMSYRLSLEDRPEWENPYFYLLLIGDLQLKQENPKSALQTYELAQQSGVDINLVSDRYRTVANWHYEHDNYQDSFDILMKHRDTDRLIFETSLDKVARKLAQKNK